MKTKKQSFGVLCDGTDVNLFTISGFSSLIAVVQDLIYYAIAMGITGAFGGAIASKD